MAGQDQMVFGLDIGTRSVVGTVGYKQTEDTFTVVAQTVRYHDTRAMLDGQIHDINKVVETIELVKKDLEKQTGRKLTDVCIAAAGRVLKTVTVHAQMDFGQEATINQETIHSLEMLGVEKAYAEIRKINKDPSVHYYCVAYTVVHYYLNDFQISRLEEHKASRIGADILATFLPDEVVDGLYTSVDKAGLKVVNLTLEPIAAIQVAIPEKYRLLNIALVDVGAGTSDICITKDGSIVAYGMIPKAGDCLTEALLEKYLVDFSTAEEIKLQVTSKKKTIVYTDIMGITQKTTPNDVIKTIAPVIVEMAGMVAEKIKQLNGGKPVSAVFIVGGGGKIPGYPKALAAKLGISEERVALRGEEVLGDVTFLQKDIKKDPMLVTPIGICLNYYEKRNNFIFVSINGESVKLYDNNKVAVIDAAIQVGYPNEQLFPRRGKGIKFTLNGVQKYVKGEIGEPATITVNQKIAAINTKLEQNDVIHIKESTCGAPAKLSVAQLPDHKSNIRFVVNGKELSCPRFIEANKKLVSEYYEIQDGDNLITRDYYTVEQLLQFLDIAKKGFIRVNHENASLDTKVYENFTVDVEMSSGIASYESALNEALESYTGYHSSSYEKRQSAVIKTEEHVETNKVQPSGSYLDQFDESGAYSDDDDFDESSSVYKKPDIVEKTKMIKNEADKDVHLAIIVNKTPVMLKGKQKYSFVDILDFYPFDVSTAHGSEVCMTLNGEKAQFSDPINSGDFIELYWR